ncbi:amino acid adenylation domain-containing protein [Streptomyces sp. NBC_00882]|uniref:amino acid adenylation domain-containing protein n=1 Tax=Streptomyces TaxID=1883 RepID=UPI00386A79B3|nr:amino acid adenylation domain-containing protein [Streptomyces sp. NBC_00882]WSZ61866.1 amino acid adenylation domain-containing protein [Streptomyces canus]
MSIQQYEHRPLSGAQEGLWFAGRLATHTAAYNTGEYVEIHGPVDTGLFEAALRRTVREADTFALRFVETPDGPRCVPVDDPDDWPLHRLDVSAEPDPQAAAEDWIRRDLATATDLVSGALFSHALITLGPDRFIWFLRAHHIVLDGYSYKQVARRLADTYTALAAGREPEPAGFEPVARLQAEEAAYLASERHERDRAFWASRLAGLPDPVRLTERTAPPQAPFLRCTHDLTPAENEALSEAAARLGVSPTDLLVGAVAAYLHRMTGADDLVLGLTTMSRLGSAALRTPGTASDILPLRVAISPTAPVGDLMRSVAEELRSLRRHQQYRGESVRRDLGLVGAGRKAYGPVVNVVPFAEDLTFAGRPSTSHHLSGGAVDDLQISVRPGAEAGGLWLAFDANPSAYEQTELDTHLRRFLNLLDQLATGDEQSALADVSLLLPGEQPQTRPVRTYTITGTLTQRFEEQAARAPHTTAVTCEREHLSYAELNAEANRLAGLLVERGAGPGRMVALALPRGIRLVVALLAVLKTGAAYLPLDTGHPAERLRLVTEDVPPTVLVTDAETAGALPAIPAPTVVLGTRETDEDLAVRPPGDLTDADRTGPTGPDDLAYIIHTSGSTGRPKGVPIPHSNVLRLFEASNEHYDFGADDVWSLFHSYAFDVSVWEFWGALLHGGRLVVVPSAVTRSPRDFLRLLREERVTVLSQTPSAFEHLMQADLEDERAETALRYVVFAGEALRMERLRPWADRYGLDAPALINMYGITETTVHSTFQRLTRAHLDDPRRPSVIGLPLADLCIHLLDASLRPVPPGVTGEIYVSGPGLAPGYHARPELTAERFVEDPFGPPGTRMYRSGDLARRRADGILEYAGRADHQVKIRGFRIEPGEIQAVLADHADVASAAVVVRRTADGDPQLVAYAVPVEGHRPDPAELRAHLAERLPGHMVPAACVLIDALPLTANGKLDVRALPEPDFTDAASGQRPTTPEQSLVCRLFAEVLRLPEGSVSVVGNFFDLGGHSLLAVRLLARLRAETGEDIPMTVLFDTPTPAALALRLTEESGSIRLPPLEAAARPARVALSFAQERMWFLNRLDGASATYNIPLVVPLEHDLDEEALRAALADVVDRHESLRTVFADDGDGAHQRILPPGTLRPELRIVDCPGEEVDAQVAAAGRHRFDLTRESALWAAVVGSGARRTLLLVLHHSAADGWSLRPLAEDLSAAYEARGEGRAPHGKPLPVQYADYALWQRGVLAPAPEGPGRLEQLTGFWREVLAGLPEESTLPADRARPAVAGGAGASVSATVDAALHARLERLADAEGGSLFMVLHTAVAALLSRWGAGTDLAIGTPVAGRSEAVLDDVIGLVTNTLVLRTDASADPDFRELLARTRRFDLAALDHQDLPFDLLVDDLNPPRHPARHPLFQVMLALQNNEPAVLRLGDQSTPLRPTATGTAKFDLFVDVLERRDEQGAPQGLDLHVEYATDLFAPETAVRFAEALSAVLGDVCANPALRVSDLPARRPRPQGPPDDLAAVALNVAGVRDAVALPSRDASDAPSLYVVPGRATAPGQVEQTLGAARVTAVNGLPRTPDGALDVDALRALPAVDRTAATRWERELARLTGVREATVEPEDIPEELGRIHAGPPRPGTQPEASPETTPRTDRVPALSEGPLLPEPSVSGWAAALTRAAAKPHGEIVHVRADGSETRRSYASLVEEGSRVLAGLRQKGLRPGDQVILQCSDTEDFVAVLWGCVLGGFVAVPLTVPTSYATPSAAVTKLEGIWRMLDRPWIVASPSDAPGLRELAGRDGWPGLRLTTADALREAPEDRDWHEAAPGDLILMLMTSGSTGLPKAVRITHRGVLTRSAATEAMNGLGEHDVSLNWIPLDHVTGVVMFHLRDVYLGCRQIHAPTSWILQDPLRWADLADRHRVTVTWAPNFAFGLLAEQAHRFEGRTWDLSPMRLVMNAGEVVVASAARRFLHVLGPFGLPQDVMHPGWGMSETCSVVTDCVLPAEPPGHDESFVSCGLPYPGFAMRVVDDRDTLLAEGDVGRLQVRGTSVTEGYYDNAKANAQSFTEDSWFDTGDLAFLRDGELYITGRAKDVIIVNGVNHFSHEIESCVEELPCVVRSFTAAVAVRSDPSTTTDELALYFHLAEGHDPAGALREIGGKVTREIGVSPAFLIPVGTEDIPKTEIGKIQRTKLRKSFEAGDFDEAVREAQLLLGGAATLPDWFLLPVWQRADALHPPLTAAGRHVLVLAGREPEAAARVAGRLRAAGGLCTVVAEGRAYERIDAAAYRVRPAEVGDFAAVLERLGADGREVDAVIRLGSDGDTDPAESLLAFARALIDRHDPKRPLPLLFATAGAHAVTPHDRPRCDHATSVGLLKSLREEQPWLRGVHVDVAPNWDVEALLGELTATPVEAEVAHRDGHRYVRRLAPLPDPLPRTQPSTAGFHLISGGLGGVGVEIAQHLLKTPGTRLLLLGRGEPSDELRRLAQLGDVRWARADVTDTARVRAAVREAGEAWGVPLTSVLHLAGAFDERPVSELDTESWRTALDAKVRGAWALHEVAAEHPVDSFVTFSSVNGYFGGAMNSAYAAANAFLDALAVHRRHLGLPGQSLAWSMWRERGMSRGYGLTSLTEARGYRVLDPAAALRSFDFARSLDEPQVLIGADRTAPWVRGHVVDPVRQVRRLAARVALDEGTDLGALYRDAARIAEGDVWVLRSAGMATDRSEAPEAGEESHRLEQRLAGIWCTVLGRDRVGRDDNFFDLGGNSLLLVGAQAALNKELGCELDVVDLFAHPTVRALARHLVKSGVAPGDVEAAPAPDRPTGLDRAKQQAQRQRAARGARRSVHGRKDRTDG